MLCIINNISESCRNLEHRLLSLQNFNQILLLVYNYTKIVLLYFNNYDIEILFSSKMYKKQSQLLNRCPTIEYCRCLKRNILVQQCKQRLKEVKYRPAASLQPVGPRQSTRTALFITPLTYKSTSVSDPKRSRAQVLILMQFTE